MRCQAMSRVVPVTLMHLDPLDYPRYQCFTNLQFVLNFYKVRLKVTSHNHHYMVFFYHVCLESACL